MLSSSVSRCCDYARIVLFDDSRGCYLGVTPVPASRFGPTRVPTILPSNSPEPRYLRAFRGDLLYVHLASNSITGLYQTVLASGSVEGFEAVVAGSRLWFVSATGAITGAITGESPVGID